MRYFKYKDTNETEKNALKEQYTSLTKDEKLALRKAKMLSKVGTIIFFVVSIGCFLGGGFLIGQIPSSENLLLEILHFIGNIVLWSITVIVGIVIGGIAALPFWATETPKTHIMKRKLLSEACAHLREYYELQEPCLVTKCYESSDKKFTNHDVCIFIVGDELRITTNLKHGFFHGENDLGCYAFKTEEISLSKRRGEQYLMAELKADNIEFLLGYRAKKFIERNFLASINECGKDGSNYTIRPIQPKDNKAIEQVIRTCLIEFGANHEGTAWADPNLGRFSEIYNKEGNTYWVAEDETGKIVGGTGIGDLEGAEGVCELQKMYCLPEARGTGIAHKLMQQALEYATQYYKKCYLETLPNMIAAQKFYEKYGFERIDTPLGKTGHFACDVIYIKELSL